MLDARKLRLLCDVAATGTIAAAAERAGCTAAAASQQLAALERQVEMALLERYARSVRLTDAGRVLVEHAHHVLAALDDAERAVREAAGLRGGRLRVAAYATAVSFVVPALAALRRQHPDLELFFTELEPEDAIPALRTGEIDLAVTHQYSSLPRPDLSALSQRPLLREPLLLVQPTGLPPMQPAGPVDLADYATASWISTRTHVEFQTVTELACRAAGFEPDIAFRVDSSALTLQLVAAGLGVALMPRPTRTPRGVSLVPISPPARLFREVYATTRAADRSPAVVRLHENLTRQIRRLPTDQAATNA